MDIVGRSYMLITSRVSDNYQLLNRKPGNA